MTRALLALTLIAALLGGCSSHKKDCSMSCCSTPTPGGAAETGPAWKKVRHVVLFKFKAGTPEEKIREVEKAFAQLPRQIPGIVAFEWGTNVSPEDHAMGYTHCFLVTFKDASARDTYLTHPAHEEFKKLVGPVLEQAHVIDIVVHH